MDPQFTDKVLAQINRFPMTVHVKARIDVDGNVVSSEVRGGDSALYGELRNAINRWKFFPAVTEAGARCVDTEINFTIHAKS